VGETRRKVSPFSKEKEAGSEQDQTVRETRIYTGVEEKEKL
jgi:hypothetical protein